MLEFEPIDNQALAQIAGCDYNTPFGGFAPIFYGRTHDVGSFFSDLARQPACALVTSFSDALVTDTMAECLPTNVVKWFSNNVDTGNPRVVSVPIGFAYNRQRTKGLMGMVVEGPLDRENLLYVNFTRHIRPHNPRKGLYSKFGEYDWATVKGGDGMSSVPPSQFYADIQRHHYVLSPPGAGPDCHRHWEAMALGSIPVVLRSKAVEILGDMPALLVDSWDQISKEFLEESLIPMMERFEWDSMRRLDMGYWRGQIHEAAGIVRDSA